MRYSMNDNKVLANAMIDISKFSGRCIIGSSDLKEYSRLLKQAFATYGVDVGISSSCLNGSISTLSDIDTNVLMNNRKNGWLEDTCPQYADYYMMVPWVSVDDLEKMYRSDFPLDSMFLKFDNGICNNISEPVDEERAYMNSAYQNALQGFQEDVTTSLERSSEDVKKYTRRLAAIQSKMTK